MFCKMNQIKKFPMFSSKKYHKLIYKNKNKKIKIKFKQMI